LAPSLTFVKAQAEALRKFVPYYAGARGFPGGGLPLLSKRTIWINEKGTALGKIKEVPFKVFGFAPFFFRSARKFQPALVHAHGGPNALVAVPLARWLGIPLIATFHGSDVTVDPKNSNSSHYTVRKYWRQTQVMQTEAQLCVAVSRFVHSKLLEIGYPSEKTVLHYVGVDTAFFSPNPDVHRDPVVLFVGTLHEVKGCEYLIRAMIRVQAEIPDAELVVMGDGPLRPDLERMAKENLRRFRFLGTQPRETVRHWMNRAKVFSVPSAKADSGATEAFGLVFVESQAMGLPVASFVSGGIPEAVADGETGLLACERDWEGLASNILLLFRDDELWKRMSEAGRKRVSRLFNLEIQTGRLEELYCEVLRKNNPLERSVRAGACSAS
jgi:glycosyltransferase involved in cell wall biosynthesis